MTAVWIAIAAVFIALVPAFVIASRKTEAGKRRGGSDGGGGSVGVGGYSHKDKNSDSDGDGGDGGGDGGGGGD